MRRIRNAGLVALITGAFIPQAATSGRAAVISYTSTSTTSSWTGVGPAPTGTISVTLPDSVVDGGEFYVYASYRPGDGYGNYRFSSNSLTLNNQLARYRRAPYPSFGGSFSNFVYSDGRDQRLVPEIGGTDDYLDDPYAAWILVQVDFSLTFANGQVTSSHGDFWDGVGPDFNLNGIGTMAAGSTLSDDTAAAGGCPSPESYYCQFTGSWSITDYVAASTTVPEPGTFALMVVGLVALKIGRRR